MKQMLSCIFLGVIFIALLFIYRQERPIYGVAVRTADAEYFLPNRQFSCEGTIETSFHCSVDVANLETAVEIEFGDQYPFATNCTNEGELCTVKHLYYYQYGQEMRPYIELDSSELELSFVQKMSMGTQSVFIGLLLGIESLWISFLAIVFTGGLFAILWRAVIGSKHQPSFRITIGNTFFQVCLWLFGLLSLCIILAVSGIILD